MINKIIIEILMIYMLINYDIFHPMISAFKRKENKKEKKRKGNITKRVIDIHLNYQNF